MRKRSRFLTLHSLGATLSQVATSQPTYGFTKQFLEYVPATGSGLYQIKKGETDDPSDLLDHQSWYGQPICMKKAGGFRVSLVDSQTEYNLRQVKSARLYDAMTGATLWQSSGQSP